VGLTDEEDAAMPAVVVLLDRLSIVKKRPEEEVAPLGVTLRTEIAVCCESTCRDGVLLRSASLRRFFVAPTFEEAVVKVWWTAADKGSAWWWGLVDAGI
jgi:hypothetical protein